MFHIFPRTTRYGSAFPGPSKIYRRGLWRKSFSMLCFGTTKRCIDSSTLTQGRSPGVPIRQEAGWAPHPRSSNTSISLPTSRIQCATGHCTPWAMGLHIRNATAQYVVTEVAFKRVYVSAYLTVIIANNKNADIHSSNFDFIIDHGQTSGCKPMGLLSPTVRLKKWFTRKCNSETARSTTLTISKNPNFKSSLSFVLRSTN